MIAEERGIANDRRPGGPCELAATYGPATTISCHSVFTLDAPSLSEAGKSSHLLDQNLWIVRDTSSALDGSVDFPGVKEDRDSGVLRADVLE